MKFDEVYKNLNDQQKEAVDTLDGPVLVIAGPGTGKTQLLSARVANILKKTDTNPSAIVCLTFTVNAANNMRERLRGMIGKDANQIVIKTFHSLAGDIINSHPEHFYAGASLNPVSDLAAVEIMQNIFDSLPHDSPLATKYDDHYMQLANALDAIGRIKDAGINPEKLRRNLKIHQQEIEDLEPKIVEIFKAPLSYKKLTELNKSIADLLEARKSSSLTESVVRSIQEAIERDEPTGKTTHTGKLKSRLLSNVDGVKVMKRERAANKWWQDLATVYEKYQTTLYKRGYLDYSDMLLSVVDTLESNEDVRLDIQESIHYLLIDEFQDSNQAQIKLAHLLVDNPVIEKPNIMVVGDPNQTIYGFNGAMLDNITDFGAFYSNDLTQVDLTKNYRSSQEILDNSHSLIMPYTIFQPKLVAANPPSDTKVNFIAYNNADEQIVNICKIVSKLRESDANQTIAVLAGKHKSLRAVASQLHNLKIPVNYEHSLDIRDTNANSCIITIVCCLQALLDGNRGELNFQLSKLIRNPIFKFEPELLWQIALEANKNKDWLKTVHKNEHTTFLVDWLNELSVDATSESINVLVEQILSKPFNNEASLYKSFYKSEILEDALIEAQATNHLIDIASQYAQTENPSISSFIEMIKSTSEKYFRFNPDIGSYENAINVMTVHGAKGLEFDHVLLFDTDEANWKPKASRYPTPLSLPIHVNLETPSDYARLLYVAMTRAKQTLTLSYAKRIDAKTQSLVPEQLTDFIFEDGPKADLSELIDVASAKLVYPRPQPKAMKELLARKLQNYHLSATTLTHFLDLTNEGMETFIEDSILKLPGEASEVLAHGNAMHSALELAQIQTNNNRFNLEAIKRLYAKKIKQENLTEPVTSRKIAKAHKQLDLLFNELGLKLYENGISEQNLNAITKEGSALFGKIDRIDQLDEKTARVIDYKTGRPIENPQSKSQDVLIKQWRQKLQLGFYTILLKQNKSYTNKHIKTQIIQLDANNPESLYLDYEISDDELRHIEKLANAVYKRITALDIPDVSKFPPTLEGIKEFENWLISS